MRCENCGRPMEPGEGGCCRTCGLDGLCDECLKTFTAEGCPDTMRHLCLNYARFHDRGERASDE